MIRRLFSLHHKDSSQSGSTDNESSSGVPYWTAFGWKTIPANSANKLKEGVCPYSPDISYVEESPGVVRFTGSGVLRGERSFDPDDPEEMGSDGITDHYNCFGELTFSIVDLGSIWFTAIGDIRNPNTWLKEAILDKDISEVDYEAFRECINLSRLTVEGKQTKLHVYATDKEMTICAPVGSLAEAFAEEIGAPFEELSI